MVMKNFTRSADILQSTQFLGTHLLKVANFPRFLHPEWERPVGFILRPIEVAVGKPSPWKHHSQDVSMYMPRNDDCFSCTTTLMPKFHNFISSLTDVIQRRAFTTWLTQHSAIITLKILTNIIVQNAHHSEIGISTTDAKDITATSEIPIMMICQRFPRETLMCGAWEWAMLTDFL